MLNLNFNQIKSIDGNSFSRMTHLQHLNLESNQLSGRLNEYTFNGLANLITLNLGFNSMTSLSFTPKLFAHLTALKFLTLTHNQLERVESQMFYGLRSLVSLNLNLNKIVNIQRDAFVFLINLEQLNLAENRLSCIEKDFFNGLAKLKFLNLNRNLIVSIEANSFGMFLNRVQLLLYENPITKNSDLMHGLVNFYSNLDMYYIDLAYEYESEEDDDEEDFDDDDNGSFENGRGGRKLKCFIFTRLKGGRSFWRQNENRF